MMSGRYDDFKRLQMEREQQVKAGERLGRRLGQTLLTFFAQSPRERMFEKDPPETWPDEWVLTVLLEFMAAQLVQGEGQSLDQFGKGDFPKPHTFMQPTEE